MRDAFNEPIEAAGSSDPRSLSRAQRVLVLTTAFLGWLCAGIHMSITSVAMQPAAIDLLDRTGLLDRQRWQSLNAQAQPKQEPSRKAALSGADQSQLREWKTLVTQWFSWLQCAFLFGAVVGGFGFGALGDRFGRTKGMGLAILTYGIMAGAAWYSHRPLVLWICWFLACTGVGGMLPNGVALVSEAWSSCRVPWPRASLARRPTSGFT